MERRTYKVYEIPVNRAYDSSYYPTSPRREKHVSIAEMAFVGLFLCIGALTILALS